MNKMRLSLAIFLFTAVAYSQNQSPVVTSAQPSQVDAGGAAFTLTLNGSGFASNAVARWSGTALATSVASDSLLTATVPANLLAICGKSPITVTNPGAGSSSGNVAVTIRPVLTALTPNSLPAGSSGFTVTATGIGFSSNVLLLLNASGVQTTLTPNYVSTTTLTAFIPTSALTGVFPVSLQVTDPTSGGASQTLPVTLTYADVTSVNPSTIPAGGPDGTIQVFGVNFVPGAQVLWNVGSTGTPLVTQYQNSTFLLALVTADLYHNPAQIGISVKNPGASPTKTLTLIVGPDPFGTRITSLDPKAAVTGGPAFLLTVNGERFVQGSTIAWQTNPLPTTFVTSTQLTTTIPASLIAADGAVLISVITPGVSVSNTVSLPIASSSPTLDSIAPASAVAGGPAFTLTVNGNGFLPASKVIGLAGATTTFVSFTQLTASVPASAIAKAGAFVVQVQNSGGATSPQAKQFLVTAPPASISGLNPSSAPAGGAAFALTVTGAGFTANSTVQWNGTPLTTTFTSASQLTAQVPAGLIAAAGTANVTVTGDGGMSNAMAFAIGSLLPATSTAGIVNAASSAPATAPGALISIYGSNLAGGNLSASAIPLDTKLGGTTVSINGIAAPLLFVSPGQINLQVPYEVQPGPAKVVIQAGGLQSPAVNFDVAATGPGVFTVQQTDHVVAQNLPDFTLNSAQAPALPGQYVTLYVTGQGAVDNAVATGAAASGSPLSRPLAPVQVQIGGQAADIQFAGLAPGFVGLLQINVKIPNLAAGDQTVDVSIGGVKASPTVISVGAK
jgi:uncharacterized protein (TIGR03437 family)